MSQRTWGDVVPRLLELPGHEALAASPYEPLVFSTAALPTPPAKPEPPRTPRFAIQVLRFVRGVVAHARDGFRRASRKVRFERERTCLTCPHSSNEARACTACGCGVNPALSFVGLDMISKRAIASSRCPLTEPRWLAAE